MRLITDWRVVHLQTLVVVQRKAQEVKLEVL